MYEDEWNFFKNKTLFSNVIVKVLPQNMSIHSKKKFFIILFSTLTWHIITVIFLETQIFG